MTLEGLVMGLGIVGCLALVIEMGLDGFFNWRHYAKFNGRGLKWPIAVIASGAVCLASGFDLLAFAGGVKGLTASGVVVTSLLMAGGSKKMVEFWSKMKGSTGGN